MSIITTTLVSQTKHIMKITINDSYYILVDQNSYNLVKITDGSDKHGNNIEKTIGYYVTVSNALNAYIKLNFADSNEMLTIKEYIEKLNEVINQLKEADLTV